MNKKQLEYITGVWRGQAERHRMTAASLKAPGKGLHQARADTYLRCITQLEKVFEDERI